MSIEINQSVESDQNNSFNQLNNRESTYRIKTLGHTLNDKYAEQRELIGNLQVNCHVGLPADEIAVALVSEDPRMQAQEHVAGAVKTASNGDCRVISFGRYGIIQMFFACLRFWNCC